MLRVLDEIRAHRVRLIIAFFAIYVIWGSSFLGIRVASETLPPVTMMGVRFFLAGALLYGGTWLRGAPRPTVTHWRAATLVGACLMLAGNGGVTIAVQHMPTGLAALLVAIVPLWVVLLEWFWLGNGRPRTEVLVGVVVGLVGLAWLIGPGNPSAGSGQALGGDGVALGWAGLIMAGALFWALGTLYARDARLPASALQATGMQMLIGGAMLIVAGGVAGEWSQVNASVFSWRSVGALAYLILGGGVLGYSAFTWLLKETSAARVSTYAYVNPVVAVLLGWALAGEALTPRVLIATIVIVASVALITVYGSSSGPRPRRDSIEAPPRSLPSTSGR